MIAGVGGDEMYRWMTDLFPICRSITGEGVRTTLAYMKDVLPGLQIHSVPSGYTAFDWTVPDEWNISGAFIKGPDGRDLVNFADSNLHVVGYSEPISRLVDWEELEPHIYTCPTLPEAIPYITSYYNRTWGFCVNEQTKSEFADGAYEVCIDSTLKPGVLNYADIVIPGETSDEVLLSTYTCHPSLANNELSGPVVTLALALWLQSLSHRKYTYRIVFVPETIGTIVYLSKHLEVMKKNTIAGYVVSCVGDDLDYSFQPSRSGETLSDAAAKHVLKHISPDFKEYSWLHRGSDERQYCSPGVDLPVASIMRTRYGDYPEYHTSFDNLDLVSPSGLEGGFNALKEALLVIERNSVPVSKVLGEPQLGKRGLYANLSDQGLSDKPAEEVSSRDLVNILSYSDGVNSLLDIAELLSLPFAKIFQLAKILENEDLLEL